MKQLSLLFVIIGSVLCSCSDNNGANIVAKYSVEFDSCGGSTVETQYVEEGELAVEPEKPTLTDYAFVNWFVDSESNVAWDFTTPVTADVKLYAAWISRVGYDCLIYNRSDLETFRDRVNDGETELNALVMCDIELDNEPWVGIESYAGQFDGGGWCIEGLNVDNGELAAGLFLSTSNDAVIRNVVVAGDVVGADYVAGVVAYNAGSVIDCSNKCSVKNTIYGSAGGVVGTSDGIVTGCSNYGAISAGSEFGDTYLGGVVGIARGWNAVVSECYNVGDVKAVVGTTCSSGGVAGSASYIVACYNKGEVWSNSFCGGVVGYAGYYTAVVACYNLCDTVDGGVVGFSSSYVVGCYNAARVFDADSYYDVGGVVGSRSSSTSQTFSGCYFVDYADDDAEYGIGSFYDSVACNEGTEQLNYISELNSEEVVAAMNGAIEAYDLSNDNVEIKYRYKSGDNTPMVYMQ